mmetsp:Transcript_19235/g.56036  ORF Transcript_19235/g.56036 Transcript_19235/m.56036 type:complete len:282 (+) Transcript_19235:2032-2877(+)
MTTDHSILGSQLTPQIAAVCMEFREHIEGTVILYGVIQFDYTGMSLAGKPLAEYPPFHVYLVVHVGMLPLGQLFGLFLFDNFQGEFFTGRTVLANDNAGKVADPNLFGHFEFTYGWLAWFQFDGLNDGGLESGGIRGVGAGLSLLLSAEVEQFRQFSPLQCYLLPLGFQFGGLVGYLPLLIFLLLIIIVHAQRRLTLFQFHLFSVQRAVLPIGVAEGIFEGVYGGAVLFHGHLRACEAEIRLGVAAFCEERIDDDEGEMREMGSVSRGDGADVDRNQGGPK